MSKSMPPIHFAAERLSLTDQNRLVQDARDHFASRVRHAQLFPIDGDIAPSSRTTIYNVSVIHADLKEVKEAYLQRDAKVNTSLALPSQQVYSLLVPSSSHPSRTASVQWLMLQSPWRFAHTRDAICVEYMNTFKDSRGRHGFARCLRSIEHRNCPSLLDAYDFVRATVFAADVVYWETEQVGELQVVTTVDVDMQGMPQWMAKHIAQRLVPPVPRVEHLVKLTRARSNPELDRGSGSRLALLKQGSARVCGGCQASVHWWEAGGKCVACNQWICKKCRALAANDSTSPMLCVHCLEDATTEREPVGRPGFRRHTSAISPANFTSDRFRVVV